MDERDYEDAEGKGISFEDFKAQVLSEVREEFSLILDEAAMAGQLGAVLADSGYLNLSVNSDERTICFEVPVVEGGVERYVLTVDRIA